MAKLKLFKKPSENKIFTIDFTNILELEETLTTINSVYSTPSSLTITNQIINSTIVGEIKPYKAVLFNLSSGENGYEYTITVKVTSNTGREIETDVVLSVIEALPLQLDYYGSVLEGDTYFNNILSNDSWITATNPIKRVAIIQASLQIDTYNYRGDKKYENQILQFPRDFQASVPDNVLYATFELANQIIKGRDRELVSNTLGVKRDRFDRIETEYDPRFVSEPTRNQMPSSAAWAYLKPYFRNPIDISFERIS